MRRVRFQARPDRGRPYNRGMTTTDDAPTTRSEEMTCVIPGRRLTEVVETLEATVGLDRMMASYASADAKRFG